MEKIVTFVLLVSALHAAHAQEFPLNKNANQTAKELKTTCQKLKVAQNNCVIAHFKSLDDSEAPLDAEVAKKPSDFYRVLLGKTDQNAYVIADYYNNGQVLSPPYTTLESTLITRAWVESDLNATTLSDHTLYYKNGQPAKRFTVINGSFEGPFTNWYDNGQMNVKGTYKNDQLNGDYQAWNQEGQLTEQGTYENGERTGHWTDFYEDSGKKYSEATYKDGNVVGTYTIWQENGNILSKTEFNDNGEQDGRDETWYENGQKAQTSQYKNGLETGTHKYWDESGNLFAKHEYKDGERIDAEGVAENAREQAYEAAAAIEQNVERLTRTLNANQAADDLGVSCQTYKRKDQCVIAYFAQNHQHQMQSKNAKYYRVLHGKVGELFIIQDFYMNGNKQSDTVFARSYGGVLSGFDNSDLSIHGSFQTYTPAGKVESSFDYLDGEYVGSDADAYDAAAAPAVDAARAAVEATVAAARATADATKE